MADETNSLRQMQSQQPANNFAPLTPEQEAELRRQAISTELPTALEILLSGGFGAGFGRAIGRGMGHAGGFIAGETGPAAANLAGRIGTGFGFLAGAGAPDKAAQDRARMNTIRDAEGQPGGFYGRRR